MRGRRPPCAPWVDSANPRVISEPAADCSWWTVFNDPVLNGLIDTARAKTSICGPRVRASSKPGHSAASPSATCFRSSKPPWALTFMARCRRTCNCPFPPNFSFYATGFNASWELDVWGRYRRMIEGSTADVDAAFEGYGETLVMLLSDVATAYVQMRTFEQRLDYARKNVDIQRGSTHLAEQRFTNGAATELDVRQARSNLAQTEALIPSLVAGRRRAANQLCILMGMPVTDLAEALNAAPIPRAPAEVAIGIPADLLRRRPDVRRAEREVAAQSAQIGVAEADLYPRLSLNGFLGYAADNFRDIFRTDSFTAFIIPSLQWNVLNYGRIVNNITAQDARLQREALEYQQTVLCAGREVEDSLVGFLQAQLAAVSFAQSVVEAQRAVELVLLQFEGGVTDFNRVFNAQSTLVVQQDQLAQAQGDIALRLVDVYRALGGGWRYFMGGQMPQVQPQENIRPMTPAEIVPAPAAQAEPRKKEEEAK